MKNKLPPSVQIKQLASKANKLSTKLTQLTYQIEDLSSDFRKRPNAYRYDVKTGYIKFSPQEMEIQRQKSIALTLKQKEIIQNSFLELSTELDHLLNKLPLTY